MTSHTNPFSPGPHPDRELLERYLGGKLDPAQEHAVEMRLEADPLLREAMEGLMMPGALEGLSKLPPHPPGASTGGTWPSWATLLSLGAIMASIALIALVSRPGTAVERTEPPRSTTAYPAAVESTMSVVRTELEALPPVPAATATRVQPPAEERFNAPHTVERERVEPMDPQPTAPAKVAGQMGEKALRTPTPSRQLLFLQGLKVVHPSEMHFAAPDTLLSPGRSAASDSRRRDSIPSGPVALPYLSLLDQALEHFSKEQYSEALAQLYVLLNARPEDVNAQFYAGLASFRLGLYPRAYTLLEQAATNRVDSFNQEARWYQARSIEQAHGLDSARAALARIAQGNGFYAEQARLHLAGAR